MLSNKFFGACFLACSMVYAAQGSESSKGEACSSRMQKKIEQLKKEGYVVFTPQQFVKQEEIRARRGELGIECAIAQYVRSKHEAVAPMPTKDSSTQK